MPSTVEVETIGVNKINRLIFVSRGLLSIGGQVELLEEREQQALKLGVSKVRKLLDNPHVGIGSMGASLRRSYLSWDLNDGQDFGNWAKGREEGSTEVETET